MNLDHLIRPHILSLTPYSSARDEYTGTDGIFLDANENPFGSPTAEAYNRYPDPHQWELKRKIATLKGVEPNQIFLGNGSDEAIDLLIRACCEPKQDNILIMPPTYGMYQVCADIQGVETLKVPLTADYELNDEAVLAAITPQTKLVWVCSPTNPTGNLLNREKIINILRNCPCLVVIDEAYIDFAESESFTKQLSKYPNLVVIQTFSKAWGLAGLRLGMAFASAEIIGILNKIKYPYNLNIATQRILLKALGKADKKDKFVEQILKERVFLTKELKTIPLVQKIFKSDSNMVFAKFENASELFAYLIDQKIIIRDRSKIKLCEGCLRITVGTRAENKMLLEAIRRYK